MSKLLLNVFKSLLLWAILTTITSSHLSGKYVTQDKSISSFYESKSIDTSVLVSESLMKYVIEQRTNNKSNNKQQYFNEAGVKQTQEQQQQKQKQKPIKSAHIVKQQSQAGRLNDTEISQTIRELFKLDDRPGLIRLDMNSDEMFSDEPETRSTTFVNSEVPHSIKVQRSPDGKLNFVVNDLVSLQTESTQGSPPHRTPISDKPLRRKSKPGILPTPVPIEQIKCEDNDGTNKTFCNKVRNYPNIGNLRPLLSTRFASFFGNDLPEPDEIGTRMDPGQDSPQDEYLCSSRTRIIYPQWGQTSDNGGQIIINNEEFKQGVRIEECTNAGSSCKYMEILMNHYVSECKQHYTYRVMASLTSDGDASTVTKQNFKFASCCKCAVRSTLN